MLYHTNSKKPTPSSTFQLAARPGGLLCHTLCHRYPLETNCSFSNSITSELGVYHRTMGFTIQRFQKGMNETYMYSIKGRRHIKVLFGEFPNAGDPLVLFTPCNEVGERHM